MQITNATLEFSSDDNETWRIFLNSQTGQRLLPKLAEAAPTLLDGADVNKTLVRNGELRGFQHALNVLLSLTEVPAMPVKPVDAYPALEDDAFWNDGKTLK